MLTKDQWCTVLAYVFGAAMLILWLSVKLASGAEPLVTPQAALEQLAWEIFFDKQVLSLRGTVSCATCHDPRPEFGYSNGMALAVGDIGNPQAVLGILGLRNVPTLVNVGSKENRLMWDDGRQRGLFNQCFTAVTDPSVMAMPNMQAVVNRVVQSRRYQSLAKLAFGDPVGVAPDGNPIYIDEPRLRRAMVAFLKTIVSENAPADALAAGEESGLPDSALRGWQVFQTHCIVCHKSDSDWRDYEFHNIGIASRSRSTDAGRGAITNVTEDNFKFATPTLREIAKTAPYMHDGSLKDLLEVALFFAAGGRYKIGDQIYRDPDIHPLVKQIGFTLEEAYDLRDFLELGFQGARYPYKRNPHEQVAEK